MKFRNRLGVVIAVVVVITCSLVFLGVQNAKAADMNGIADNITKTSMTIGNKTLVIDSNTEIVGQLVTGSIVQIRARVQDDDNLLATKIVVKNHNNDDDMDQDDDDEIEGIIESVGTNNIVINGHTIFMDEHTRIEDGRLAVHNRVEVELVKQQNGSSLATKIDIGDDEDD
jgi:hypothetical protein